jgi:hypothetical protein
MIAVGDAGRDDQVEGRAAMMRLRGAGRDEPAEGPASMMRLRGRAEMSRPGRLATPTVRMAPPSAARAGRATLKG